MRFLAPFLVLSLMTACAVPATDGTGDINAHQRIVFEGAAPTEAEVRACHAAGGDIRPAGMRGWQHCIQSFPDAGNSCADASDCMGRCLNSGEFVGAGAAVTGQCAADDDPFGCYQEISNGVAGAGICVD